MILPILTVAPSEKRGRGVFTFENIPADTVIEISPVLVLPANDRKLAEQTLLYDYIFEWGEDNSEACIGLGYLSLYNHSYDANCEYDMDFEAGSMTIRTVRTVVKGEELFINYNATANDATPIWFETA